MQTIKKFKLSHYHRLIAGDKEKYRKKCTCCNLICQALLEQIETQLSNNIDSILLNFRSTKINCRKLRRKFSYKRLLILTLSFIS